MPVKGPMKILQIVDLVEEERPDIPYIFDQLPQSLE